MRIWHADTPTRLFSGSAHKMRTLLNNLQKLKTHHCSFDTNSTFFVLYFSFF